MAEGEFEKRVSYLAERSKGMIASFHIRNMIEEAKKDLLPNICLQCCCWQRDCFDKKPSKECIKGKLQKWFGCTK